MDIQAPAHVLFCLRQDEAASVSESVKELEAAMEDDIEFSERTLPQEPFQFYHFFVYCAFLFLFCIVTIGRQGESPYLLAKFARDQIGADEFQQIDNTVKVSGLLASSDRHAGVQMFPAVASDHQVTATVALPLHIAFCSTSNGSSTTFSTASATCPIAPRR